MVAPIVFRRAAVAALVVAMPSALWRLLMIAGLLPGTDALRTDVSGGAGYVLALSSVQIGAAVAVLALTRGAFGGPTTTLHLPRWTPGVVGVGGGLLITWLFTISLPMELAGGVRPDSGLLVGGAFALMVVAYLPIVAWGPLTVVAAAGALRQATDPIRG